MYTKTLIIDNYDSFTYNIYQMVAEVNGVEPDIYKNDEITWEELCNNQYDNIIISPGPGHPNIDKDFGICKRVLIECNVPILGVCLGHQGICCAYGGVVTHAPKPVHGQINEIIHNGDFLFKSVPEKFNAVRYHSLVAKRELPEALEVTAWTADGLIMGVKHKQKPIWGIQFHPESICTDYGYQILQNFKAITENFYATNNGLNRSDRSYVEKKEPFEVVNKSSAINSLPKQSDKENYRLLVKQIEAKVNTSELYEKYCGSRSNAVWLDSNLVAKDKPALSIIGCMDGALSYIVKYDLSNKQLEITQGKEVKYIQGNIFDFLKQEIAHYSLDKVDLPFDFHCGFVGYFGYELKQDTIFVTNRHKFNHPDAQFIFLDRAIVYDHVKNKCYLLALCNDSVEKQAKCWLEETQELVISCNSTSTEITRPFKSNLPEYELEKNNDKYLNDIDKCLKYIRDGDSYEVCLTNRLIIKDHIDPLKYYLVLRQINPAPYAAFLNFDDIAIASSSMERFLRIDDKGCVETKPIKGTLPRGKDENEDQQIIASLKDEVKFKSENLMIVDLLRNDLGVVCEIGSVHVPKLMDVETYETVHQLVTTVRGQLKHNFSAIDCIKACFPGGSMTGAPKLRTLEIIDEIEESPRGVYSGSIGYLSLNGSVDLNIVIRSAQITPDELCIGVGGAIINLSDPQDEFNEILLKAKQLLVALTYSRLENSKGG